MRKVECGVRKRVRKRSRAGGFEPLLFCCAFGGAFAPPVARYDHARSCAHSHTRTCLLWMRAQADKDYLSRLLPIGHELCILPKTCLNTFGDAQPVYELGESFQPGHGGSWADPPQVAPSPGFRSARNPSGTGTRSRKRARVTAWERARGCGDSGR